LDWYGAQENDEWGIGIIMQITRRNRIGSEYHQDFDDVEVFWPKLAALSWEVGATLEMVNESG
jgi:hypothetical protein